MATILFSRLSILTLFPACLLLVLCLASQLHPVMSTNPVMRNQDITSKNRVHKANSSSYIQWGNVPKTKPIDLSDEEKSDGLEPLFKFSRFFIYNALDAKLPVDLIQKIRNGKIDLIEDLRKLAINYVGFLVAIVVGIIFVVIFPIVGFCFCICRSCGKCGGKMIQTKVSSTRRKYLSFMLFLGVAFSASGTAFMFASDVRLEEKIEKAPAVLPKVLTAAAKFGDNTYMQVDFVGTETVGFLLDVIKRDLNNLDVLVGIPLREKLDQTAKIRAIFRTIKNLDQDLKQLVQSMGQTEGEIKDLKKKSDALVNEMTKIKSDIDTDYAHCKAKSKFCNKPIATNSLSTTFSHQKLPDISNEIKKISGVDIIGQIKKPEKDFEDIPDLVDKKSKAKVKDIVKNIDDIQANLITKYLKKAKKFKTDLDAGEVAGHDLGVLTNGSSRYLDMVKPYDKIRSYAFLGLASFCLFIIGLLLFGLILGLCGNDDLVKPVSRGCASNCGGCMLMGAVAFIFLTGWLLMLLTTAMFIPGAVIEVFGCKALRRIGQGSVDDILKAVWKENPGKLLFNNGSLDVKISHIYNGCEKGQGLYKAAYLKYSVNFDSIFNYPQNMGVRKDITAIQVDLSGIKILTPKIKDELKEFQDSMKIDFAKFKSELTKIKPPGSLNSLANELGQLGQAPNPHGPKFKKHAADIRSIQNNEVQQLHNTKNKLQTTLDTLETDTKAARGTINKLKTELTFTQGVIDKDGNEIVKNVLNDFADRFFRIWNSFVKYLKNLLNNQLGNCRPITNIYNYVVIDTICGIVDSFNAYWFGLGWCLFFLLFNLIIAVKLAKYFRRMKYSDELDGSKDDMPLGIGSNPKSTSFLHQNRVGQMPRY